jgi:ABC-type antimicrobial peptide transport system permease subunit
MAYTVARRTGEIGIRRALEVLAISVAGLLVGYGVAPLTTHFVESFPYGLKPIDPLAMAALTAGCLPAWRASRIDPAVALRTNEGFARTNLAADERR